MNVSRQIRTGWKRSVAAVRIGATLSEVLVSLMIMSIGLVSVATMFPLSMVRAIQATHKTNATVLRRNAETIMEIANAQQVYFDSRIKPGVNDGRYILDPIGFHLTGDGLYSSAFQDTAMGLGPMLRANGNTDASNPPDPSSTVQSEIESAWRVCSSPDHWRELDELRDVVVSGLNGARTQVTVPGISAAGMSVGTVAPAVRVLLFDATGRICHVRRITEISTGNVVKWTEDLDGNSTLDPGEDFNFNGTLEGNALPSGFVPVTARVQVQDRRYSWIATVPPLGKTICVAVFFNRAFSLEDELVYDAAPVGSDLSTIDFATDVPAFSASMVQRLSDGNGEQDLPQFVRKGTFLLDAEGFEWYRVQNVSESIPTRVKLSTLDGRSPTAPVRAAIVMRGVVDVYPIRPR